MHGRVLELGCGTGHMQCALAQHEGVVAIGVDASHPMLRLTQQRADRMRQRVRLIRARAQDLPIPSWSCDVVLATFPSDYILDPQTLHEIRRVLTPEGQLILVDMASFVTRGWYELLVDIAYLAVFGRQDGLNPMKQSVYEQMLHFSGFQTEISEIPVADSRVQVIRATHHAA